MSAPAPDPAVALARLRAGRIDEGMRVALACLAGAWESESVMPCQASPRYPVLAELIEVLRENPFLRTAALRSDARAIDGPVIDFALELAALPGDTSPLGIEMYRWMCERGATFASLRARRLRLAQAIDEAAVRHAGAPVAGFFAGHARELSLSRAFREGRIAIRLFDFDRRSLEVASAQFGGSGRLETRAISLAEILAGRLVLGDCALVYLPTAALHLADGPLALLLETLVGALRPDGELLLPAFTRAADPGLLELAAEMPANLRSPAALLRLARDIDEAQATVEHEESSTLAWLRLRRQTRIAARARRDSLE